MRVRCSCVARQLPPVGVSSAASERPPEDSISAGRMPGLASGCAGPSTSETVKVRAFDRFDRFAGIAPRILLHHPQSLRGLTCAEIAWAAHAASESSTIQNVQIGQLTGGSGKAVGARLPSLARAPCNLEG